MKDINERNYMKRIIIGVPYDQGREGVGTVTDARKVALKIAYAKHSVRFSNYVKLLVIADGLYYFQFDVGARVGGA